MKKLFFVLSASAAVFVAAPLFAETLTVPMTLVDEQGTGKAIGGVNLTDSNFGLVITPRLNNLPAGMHGFHVHQNPDCSPLNHTPALGAGEHYDPSGTGIHAGPYGNGHKGDLPALYVGSEGKAETPVLAPRLKVKELKGRALVIHAGGDNYSDSPEKLGGGRGRIACGAIK